MSGGRRPALGAARALLGFGQGLWLGVAVVLPGISGGTAALLLGVYEQLLRDFTHFRWRPYLPLAAGVAGGVLAGSRATEWLLLTVPDVFRAFLLGTLVASLIVVLRGAGAPRPVPAGLFLAGFAGAWLLAVEPLTAPGTAGHAAPAALFLGGLVAASATVLPGVSGGTLLILGGQYDDVLGAVNRFDAVVLGVFGAGAAVGLFGMSRAMSELFLRYPTATRWVLAGLACGASRALLPLRVGWLPVLAFAAGCSLAFVGRQRKRS